MAAHDLHPADLVPVRAVRGAHRLLHGHPALDRGPLPQHHRRPARQRHRLHAPDRGLLPRRRQRAQPLLLPGQLPLHLRAARRAAAAPMVRPLRAVCRYVLLLFEGA